MTNTPKTEKSDIAHAVVKGALGAIPYAGGLASEFFALLIKPPVTKRLETWIESLSQELSRLSEKVEEFQVESLSDDEMFVTAVMHATQSAVRTHQQEKLDALRNAVMNVALHTSPDEDLQLMFLGLIDKFTPWHLRVLIHFHENPPSWMHGSDPVYLARAFPELLEQVEEELSGRVEFFQQIVHDLERSGLIDTQSPPRATSGHGRPVGKSTGLGEEFLQFITSPVHGSNT